MLPYRTHFSELTDDELIVLDIVSQYSVLPSMLRRNVFQQTWALDFTHSLDDQSLKDVIVDLNRRCLVDVDRSLGRIRIAASKRGGDAWASERLPIWSRFVRTDHDQLRSGKERVVVWSPGYVTPNEYLDSMESQEYVPENRKSVQPREDWGILPWKRFDHLYVAKADIKRDDGVPLSFERYELQRTWWLDVRQLQKFVQRKRGNQR